MTTDSEKGPLWIKTPLIYSHHISARLDCDVYLKLESLQPSQSFKSRGISLFAKHCKETHGPSVRLVIASAGNAGLAASCATKILGVKCTVFITEGASPKLLDTFKRDGAEVVIHGKHYFQALNKAKEAVESDVNAVMVPAYDDPIIWEGHSSMIEEIKEQIPNKPDAIFTCVGGGGLIGGVMSGCKKVGWDDVGVVALETNGSPCFYYSISANDGKWYAGKDLPTGITAVYDENYGVKVAHIANLTSRAASLGATSPAAGVVKMAVERAGGIQCVTVPDELSMHTGRLFAEDHKVLVELACSTTLAPAYSPELFHQLQPRIQNLSGNGRKTLVFIVCGGSKISLDEMIEYGLIADKALKEKQTVFCNGEKWLV